MTIHGEKEDGIQKLRLKESFNASMTAQLEQDDILQLRIALGRQSPIWIYTP